MPLVKDERRGRPSRRPLMPILPLLLCVASVLATTACGSSTSNESALRSSLSQLSSAPTTSASASPSPTPSDTLAGLQTGAILSATDRAGNAARITISIGKIQAASQIHDPLIQVCADQLSALGTGLDRALAVELNVNMRVQSSLPTSVGLHLDEDYTVEAGGQPDAAAASTSFTFFAKSFIDGPQCGSLPQDVTHAAVVTWNNATAQGSYVWKLYVIAANALTPNDPTGAKSDLHDLLIDPQITLTEILNNDSPTYDSANSPFQVDCQYPLGQGGGRPFIALDPVTAIRSGCQSP